jgi:photosystem II stability/assembly factor-like uncharacterized protein
MLRLLVYGLITFSNFHGCALAPDNQTGYIVTLDTTFFFKSTDGGATWQRVNTTASRKFFDVTCVDENHIWTCGILGEIMYSADGGQSWQLQVTGISKYMTRIEFLDTLKGWCVGGDGTIAYTVDGGQNWNVVFTAWYEAEFYGVTFADEYIVYALAGWPDNFIEKQGYIIRSTNGGPNWSLLKQSTGFDEYLDIHAVDQDVIVVVGGNDLTLEPIILRSTNAGYSWDSITNIPSSARYLRAVDFVENKGWAVGRSGTILFTEDGGLTWTQQFSPADSTLFDVDFSDELHGIACGYNYIIYTHDGGQTWHAAHIEGISEIFTSQAIFKAETPVFRSNVRFTVINNHSPYTIKIFNPSGQLVREISGREDGTVVWDGKNVKGQRVKSGVYHAVLEARGITKNIKLIKIQD